jgi:hypothetical protein
VKEKLIVLSKRAVAVAWEHAKAAAPLLFVVALACIVAYAGRVFNMLDAAGTDTSSGIQTAGEGMLAWQGMRIYMDEHHSVNPGRVAGAVTGSLFAFAPTSIATWASGS